MAGTSLDINTLLTPDTLGVAIAENFQRWDNARSQWKSEKEEVRRYLFATDTSTTSNVTLPWKNKTTIPKLTQIRDNLIANYMATLFPKKKWMDWSAGNEASDQKDKTVKIEAYMEYVVGQPDFKKEIQKVLTDYIDTGNCFVMPEWVDGRVEIVNENTGVKNQVGYVGPTAMRVNPFDIVFNPIANTFPKSPKIIRKVLTMGEVKEMLQALSTEETKETIDALWKYLRSVRNNAASNNVASFTQKDTYLNIDGFDSFAAYLLSGYVEVLYFFGDLYDTQKDEFYKNHKILVVDRHKVIAKEPNPSFFGEPPIYHAGWRIRQDNLWAMGPLDNLVGMQYRIDHLENLKADVFDTLAFPPLKIKGYVEDFEWGPMERIICGDDGDVELLSPPFQILQTNNEIATLVELMEQMAGAPKEAAGFRTPGEKTMYEVQRIENAYNRMYQNKIMQFEEYLIEPLLNSMLELAKRKLDQTTVSTIDPDTGLSLFMELSISDISGVGKIYPMAARNFAEKAEVLQNLNTFAASPMYADAGVRVHFSGLKMAEMLEDFFNIGQYQIVQPYVQIAETADQQRFAQASQEQVLTESQTPAGTTPADASAPFPQGAGAPPPMKGP